MYYYYVLLQSDKSKRRGSYSDKSTPIAPADDAASGIYYPTAATTFKVKMKGGMKIFVNICYHESIPPDENMLICHPDVPILEGEEEVHIYDYIVSPTRVATYLSLRSEGGDTLDSHAARLPICREAISEINLKFEPLATEKFLFPVTKGHYKGDWQCFHKAKRI
jgi:hypothetical protein